MSFPADLGGTSARPPLTAVPANLDDTTYPPALPDGSDGPALDAGLLGRGFIPQGQGYDSSRDMLLTSYNDSNEVRVTLQSTRDGRDLLVEPMAEYPNASAVLGGVEALSDPDVDTTPPNKGGGIATDGEFVYLADTEAVYVYQQSSIETARAGETIPAMRRIEMPEGVRASYLTIKDGTLYVGEFKEPLFDLWNRGNDVGPVAVESGEEVKDDLVDAWTPDLNSGVGGFFKDAFTDPLEKLDASSPIEPQDPDDEPQSPQIHAFSIDPSTGSGLAEDEDGNLVYDSTDIPLATQGVAVTDTGYLFTRSYTDLPLLAPKDLYFQPFEGDGRVVAEIDHYGEGINIVGDEVWITYEGAAEKLHGEDGPQAVQRLPLYGLDISREELGI